MVNENGHFPGHDFREAMTEEQVLENWRVILTHFSTERNPLENKDGTVVIWGAFTQYRL